MTEAVPITAIQGSSFATGLEVQEKRRRVLTISTGSKAVDNALGGECMHIRHNCSRLSSLVLGGLMSQSITEGMLWEMGHHLLETHPSSSVRRVQDRQDSAGSYHECCSSVAVRHGWCLRQSNCTNVSHCTVADL